MFPTNETNNSFFGFGLPVSFPKLMAGLFYFQTMFIPMSDKIEASLFSNWLSSMFSGIPDKAGLYQKRKISK